MKIKDLDRNEVYSLEEIKKDAVKFDMLKEWLEKNCHKWTESKSMRLHIWDSLMYNLTHEMWYMLNGEPTKCALTLFELDITDYQVDCSDLSKEQIEEMAEVVKSKGFDIWNNEDALITDGKNGGNNFFKYDGENYYIGIESNKVTITYGKFIELFGEPQYEVKYIAEQPNEVFNPQQHYFNEPKQFRSLFELSHVLELNDWEFDILKRLVRCRKKGQFKEDLKKIKDTVDIYLNEYEN